MATNLAGRAHEVGVSIATGVLGGVRPSGYRGSSTHDDGWECDPWGWSSWSGGFHVSYSWCGWGWSYPWYWSLYYPCWWWASRPYYYYDYCAYPSTTVIYTQPDVVYVNAVSEPVGESVLADPPPATARPEAAAISTGPSPLSIAAQRYLDLGDRAFREGRYSDAVQFYAKAVEFAPDQGALYLVLADALFAAGDYHYAAYAVRRAVELDPALVDTGVDKHGFYPEPKVFDEHLAALEHYLFEHPDDRDARLVLALNYLFGARASDAVRTLENAAIAEDLAAQRILSRAKSQHP